MYRLAILFLSYILSSHALVRHTVDLSRFDDNGLNPIRPQIEKEIENTPLWVLDLNTEDLGALKLRVGSETEEKEFEFAAGGTIKALERNQRFANFASKRVKKDDPMKTTQQVSSATKKENEILMKDIVKTVNKFVLASMNLDGVDEIGPSLSLYFKGPYTSLTVKMGAKQWHYFIQPPSPFPGWFYTPHPSGRDVEIPTEIRNTFYKSLLHILQMFFGFPL